MEKKELDVIKDMMKWCRQNEVTTFAKLCDYAAAQRPKWFALLASGGYGIMVEYVSSMRLDRGLINVNAVEHSAERLPTGRQKQNQKHLSS